jgi:uncharacterized membrane protein YgdD (TMEM256/DUF423 family)
MPDRSRRVLALSALLGLTAVALGAFGAHGLEAMTRDADDAARRLEWWRTGAHYQLAHALAVGIAAPLGRWMPPALFTAGTTIFSGTLYAMALGGPRWLGAITPVGGVLLMAGWAALAALALRRPDRPAD